MDSETLVLMAQQAALNAQVAAIGTTVQSYLSENATLVADTATNLVSVSLTAGTWVLNAQAYAEYTGANASFDPSMVWVGPTSASIDLDYAGAAAMLGDSAGNVTAASMAFMAVEILDEPTTVYLIAESLFTATFYAFTPTLSTPNATGLCAVRIA